VKVDPQCKKIAIEVVPQKLAKKNCLTHQIDNRTVYVLCPPRSLKNLGLEISTPLTSKETHLMIYSKRTLSIAISAVLVSLLISAYAKQTGQVKSPPLGIEIALDKAFYVPAAASGKVTSVVIRVPVTEGNSQQQDSVSAIKLEPKMENDKVRVDVYALIGDTDNIINCRDWKNLKAISVGTYVAGLDEDVSLLKLRDYGVRLGGKDPLTFRVVPKRTLSPLPAPDGGSGSCDCASCGGLICCPNPGFCLNCNPCGSVCCSSEGGGDIGGFQP
jgi:hypothetical protein